jgi:enoyl-CoA hydratase/carnithine racemase
MRFVGDRGWLQQSWGRAELIPGTGGAALLHRPNPTFAWRLLDEQPRLDAAECAELGLAETAAASGRDAALDRARQLSVLPRDVLEVYVALLRPLGWPSNEHFTDCARFQSGFIGSERFRSLAERLLRDV